ncbi:MAG TPA: ribosome biogenesis GTP-binding protein YihA/YsxC [Gammaproteobacteria bacterium]
MSAPKFVKSAASASDFPRDEGREVAFVGRSNSGKSSAINAIFGARKLARVSKTPGRTQLVNFFEIAPGRRIVDLPGYGYARVTPDVRERWRRLLAAYFEGRRSLAGLLLTVDVRRGLGEQDEQMLAWAERLGLPVVALLTKADKLPRGQALERQREAAARLGGPDNAILFSALRRDGVAQARERLEGWLEEKEGPGCGIQGTHPGPRVPVG